jgi:hypothetical protein
LDWSVPVSVTLSAPGAIGVKLTAAAKLEPPSALDAHVPVVLTVAVAVELALAAKVTAGAGLPLQAVSFRIAFTGLSVVEGLTAVPTGDAGTVTLFTVTRATPSLFKVAFQSTR